MKEYIDVLVEGLKKGANPLDALAAFVAAWATVDSSNILSTQIRRRLGLSYIGSIQEAFNNLLSRISSDQNFRQKAIEALALALERDWVRNAIKEAAWRSVAQQLKAAAEELWSHKRSYSIKVFLEDIQSIISSQQVRSFYDVAQPSAPAPQPAPSPPAPQPTFGPPSPPPTQAGPAPQVQRPPVPEPPQKPEPSPPIKEDDLKPDIKFEDLLSGGPKPTPSPQEQKPAPTPAPQSPEISAQPKPEAVYPSLEKMLDTVQMRLSKLMDDIRKLGEAAELLMTFRKWFEDQVKELKDAIKNTETAIVQVKNELSAIRKEVEELKKKVSSVTESVKAAEPAPPADVKAAFDEVFKIIEDIGETELPSAPGPPVAQARIQPTLPIEQLIEEEMQKFLSKRKEEKVIPPYVFIVAIGNLRKLSEILSGFEEPGYQGRWKLIIAHRGKQSTIFVQALHKNVPMSLLNEAFKLGDGILVLTPVKDIAKLNNVLAGLASRIKKCKFVLFDTVNPGTVSVPKGLKDIRRNINSAEDLKKVIVEEIFPLF